MTVQLPDQTARHWRTDICRRVADWFNQTSKTTGPNHIDCLVQTNAGDVTGLLFYLLMEPFRVELEINCFS